MNRYDELNKKTDRTPDEESEYQNLSRDKQNRETQDQAEESRNKADKDTDNSGVGTK